MKPTQKQVKAQPERQGIWPFSLTPFDRTPSLSPLERANLSTWHSHWLKSGGHSSAEAEQGLYRLLVPLDAVLASYGRSSRMQRAARAYILNTMNRTQTCFWAWGEREWLDCVGARYEDFSRFDTHPTTGTYVRTYVLTCAYLLSDAPIMRSVIDIQQQMFVRNIFGTMALREALAVVVAEATQMGFGKSIGATMPVLLSEAFLLSRSPYLKDLTLPILHQLRDKVRLKKGLLSACIPLSQILCNLSILPQPLEFESTRHLTRQVGVEDTIAAEWFQWVERWYAASTSSSRKTMRTILVKAGRWCGATQQISSPLQWTRDTCIAYVAAVNEMKKGEWMHPKSKMGARRKGQPLAPSSKVNLIMVVRIFFADCQEWGWLPTVFKPSRYLPIPPSIKPLLVIRPRVIADDIWAKLMHAGISLTPDEINSSNTPKLSTGQMAPMPYYPWEMIHAVVIVWLFAGLRANEIKRLSFGCIRWEDLEPTEESDNQKKNTICWLTVPDNKTSPEFAKPVDPMVGHAIQLWEKIRPEGPAQWDIKSGREVQYLFRWRARLLGRSYINKNIIPMLCRKAGVPGKDAKGTITSHRARATIATQLFNAPEPFTLLDGSKWLGHKSLNSTRGYIEISLTKLAESYTKAGYYERNRRMIDVLVDQEAIRNGAVAAGQHLLLYDLGHGLCSYDFFAKCKHRMACAKCSFYQPKESSYIQMLEAKGNLIRLKQSVILSKEEIAAVDDGITALEKLSSYLQDIATPQGPTPRELHG